MIKYVSFKQRHGGQLNVLRHEFIYFYSCFVKCAIVIVSSAVILFSTLCLADSIPIRPHALEPGDTVGLISSGFRVDSEAEVRYAVERLNALGLKAKLGQSILKQEGYLAGTDELRAQDINSMFADSSVRAIFQLRGGWGSARLLKYLDFDTIKNNPKIFMGFSDITSLLLAIHARTGLITFHGPLAAAYPWPTFTVNYVKGVLFEGELMTFENPLAEDEDDLTRTQHQIQVIADGETTGRMLGGNLTVLTSLLGTGYLPSWDDKILFVEDVAEDVYEVDRMLTQLELAGVLSRIRGFVFGTCTDCLAKTPYGSYRLLEVIKQHIEPLKIPAWFGAMIGHQEKMFVLPEGVLVKINASKGTIKMLEPAVQLP